MNCGRFQNQLYEYVEGTLSAGDLAAAERHLAGCDACRQALQNEQHLTQALSGRLRQKVEPLTLSTEMRQRILAAARQPSTTPTLAESLMGLWNRVALPATMATVVMLVIALLVVTHFSNQRIHEVPRDTATADFADQYSPPPVSIQMSCPVPTYQFHREGDQVVDTVSYETVVASGMLRPDGQKPVHL